MNNPTIIIVHNIKNRLRIKISHPLRNKKFVIDEILRRDGIDEVTYNEITKSILFKYSDYKISNEELIMRFIAVYSKDFDLMPIRFVYDSSTKKIPPMAYYSLATIIFGGISKYLTVGTEVGDFLNWAAVGTTVGAIGEHAYNEINERGYFDPEVVSVMYLVNSVSKGNFIMPSAITWFTTFGRHILDISNSRLMVNVREIKNHNTNESYYDVTVAPDVDKTKRSNTLRMFLEKFIEVQGNNMRKSFILTNNGVIKGTDKILSGFQEGPSFIVSNEKSTKILNNVIR